MALCYEPSFFLDDKMIPLIDEVQPPRGAVAVPVPLKPEYYKPDPNPTYLFNEFEKVYFELNHNALTPPQSPPSEPTIITTLEPLMGVSTYQQVPVVVPDTKPQEQQQQQQLFPANPDNYDAAATPQPDIAHELAVVDELVRTTIDDMQWASGPSSPESSSNSNFGDCSSSSSEDPEWTLDHAENYKDTSFGLGQKAKRRGSKPYSASPDDKKSRKKEQNKNAATRYRMKKKAEVEEILNEEKGLLDKHGELTNQITDLQREIKYLKGLMRDLLKAKGVIS
ncbi:activating transcription factor of chaperone isoform X2 [Anthonomus grandis grandis]|uniref:activating transcription factor of chaperone isoform X2 n=1 Tax=Anthonomus grandis grandis TaxID=2921223 RepID=UPI0021653341|nr:activating transcription factor of chaperone isoform X2 [Anthonomus grandis grandis]